MIPKKNIHKSFYLFLFLHLLLWTLVPSLSNVNLPLDTIEALAWGSNLDWGFNKHPPFSAFAVEFFYLIFGNSDWSYYLLSQIFVVTSLFFVWKFSNEIFEYKFNNENIKTIEEYKLKNLYVKKDTIFDVDYILDVFTNFDFNYICHVQKNNLKFKKTNTNNVAPTKVETAM